MCATVRKYPPRFVAWTVSILNSLSCSNIYRCVKFSLPATHQAPPSQTDHALTFQIHHAMGADHQNPPRAPVDLRLFSVDYDTEAMSCEVCMNTLFHLMAQYDARAIVPAETACKDYFSHLTLAKFLRKIGSGDIDLPLTRSEKGQKIARGIYIQDLAKYLDRRRAVALSEGPRLSRSSPRSKPTAILETSQTVGSTSTKSKFFSHDVRKSSRILKCTHLLGDTAP